MSSSPKPSFSFSQPLLSTQSHFLSLLDLISITDSRNKASTSTSFTFPIMYLLSQMMLYPLELFKTISEDFD